MTIVFLLEEKSTKVLLDFILPRILPEEVSFVTIPHEGKSDLKRSIPVKLAGWNTPDTKFVIIQDQDSNDCRELKRELTELCRKSGKDTLIRIACHEMEAWYFGDLEAVGKAYGREEIAALSGKRKYRVPDAIESPKQELRKLIPEHEQINGARKIGAYMDVERNTSKSFNVLVRGIRNLIQEQG